MSIENYSATMSESDAGFRIAIEEARQGAEEGGIPVGACLVAKDGKILGRGHNMRVQKDSATLHVSTLAMPSLFRRLRPHHPCREIHAEHNYSTFC
jgi:tRNA(Arg) A34 adenosine deaminase TadA